MSMGKFRDLAGQCCTRLELIVDVIPQEELASSQLQSEVYSVAKNLLEVMREFKRLLEKTSAQKFPKVLIGTRLIQPMKRLEQIRSTIALLMSFVEPKISEQFEATRKEQIVALTEAIAALTEKNGSSKVPYSQTSEPKLGPADDVSLEVELKSLLQTQFDLKYEPTECRGYKVTGKRSEKPSTEILDASQLHPSAVLTSTIDINRGRDGEAIMECVAHSKVCRSFRNHEGH
jgi:hypothetical protein